jgi:formate-dependent nitrite reductase membrane component NrfD
MFATREIGLTFMSIARPVLIQAIVCIAIVLSILLIVKNIQLSNFPMMTLKGVLFLIGYMLLNWLFKIKSFKFVQEQFVPIFEKLKKRRGKVGT